jgi:hypothetical protein
VKTAKIAIAVLLLLATAILANSYYIKYITSDLTKRINAVDIENTETAKKEFEGIYNKFKKAERYISLTVSHDDLTNIEEGFADIMGAFEAGAKNSIIMIKSRLTDALEHLGRLSGINLDSII